MYGSETDYERPCGDVAPLPLSAACRKGNATEDCREYCEFARRVTTTRLSPECYGDMISFLHIFL